MTRADEPGFHQFDAFRDNVRETFLDIDLSVPPSSHGFKAEFRKRAVGQILTTMARTSGLDGPLCAHRGRRHILAEHQDHMVFMLVRAGILRHTQFGRTTVTMPGYMVLIDSMEPYHVEHCGPAATLNIRVPKSLLRSALGAPERYCGIAIDARFGLKAVQRDALVSVWRRAGSFSLEEEPELTCRIVQAIGDLCTSTMPRAVISVDACSSHFQRARAFIEAHLDDSELRPSQIAAALRISVGHLHAVTRSRGTSVTKLISTLRLERARQALIDPRLRDQTIARIAIDRGFVDAAHFSRRFKARFGMTPRQCRSASH
jgi:AraC-like DNA-binding protein